MAAAWRVPCPGRLEGGLPGPLGATISATCRSFCVKKKDRRILVWWSFSLNGDLNYGNASTFKQLEAAICLIPARNRRLIEAPFVNGVPSVTVPADIDELKLGRGLR